MITKTVLRRVLAKLEAADLERNSTDPDRSQRWNAQARVELWRLMQNDATALDALAEAMNAESR